MCFTSYIFVHGKKYGVHNDVFAKVSFQCRSHYVHFLPQKQISCFGVVVATFGSHFSMPISGLVCIYFKPNTFSRWKRGFQPTFAVAVLCIHM